MVIRTSVILLLTIRQSNDQHFCTILSAVFKIPKSLIFKQL